MIPVDRARRRERNRCVNDPPEPLLSLWSSSLESSLTEIEENCARENNIPRCSRGCIGGMYAE